MIHPYGTIKLLQSRAHERSREIDQRNIHENWEVTKIAMYAILADHLIHDTSDTRSLKGERTKTLWIQDQDPHSFGLRIRRELTEIGDDGEINN